MPIQTTSTDEPWQWTLLEADYFGGLLSLDMYINICYCENEILNMSRAGTKLSYLLYATCSCAMSCKLKDGVVTGTQTLEGLGSRD